MDEGLAQKMEEMYLSDLENSTEIVLKERHKIRSSMQRRHRKYVSESSSGLGSVGRAGVGAIRIGNAVGAAITNRRVLGPAEIRITLIGGFALVILAILSVIVPRWVTVPIAVISGWFGIALLVKTWRLRRMRLRDLDKNEGDKAYNEKSP